MLAIGGMNNTEDGECCAGILESDSSTESGDSMGSGGSSCDVALNAGLCVILIVGVVLFGIMVWRRWSRRKVGRGKSEYQPVYKCTSVFDRLLVYVKKLFGRREPVKHGQRSIEAKHECRPLWSEFNELCRHGPGWCIDLSDFYIVGEEIWAPLPRHSVVRKGFLKLPGLDEVPVSVNFGFDESWPMFFNEVKNFQRIWDSERWHENIVRFMGGCGGKDGLYTLTEFCEGGSVERYLSEIRPTVFALPQNVMRDIGNGYYVVDAIIQNEPVLTQDQLSMFLKWCYEIASGMEYLGERKIVHMDLAPRNILLKGGVTKICDLSLAVESYEETVIKLISLNYVAPETVGPLSGSRPIRLSPSLDVWAYGLTVWQIFTIGDRPYPDVIDFGLNNFSEILRLVGEEHYRHPRPLLAPQLVYDKILECWAEDPSGRPSFTSLREYFELMAL